MISKNKAKYIISLQKKKVRDEESLYVIEGDKLVKEFLSAKQAVKILIAKPEFLNTLSAEMMRYVDATESVSYEELKNISSLKTPHNAIAVIHQPVNIPDIDEVLKGLCIALDVVQDPGNLGTIIRAAAWFGIKNIICSYDCADVYNPKVIQSSMGALLHVSVFYHDLKELLTTATKNTIPVYGTVLEGISVYKHQLDKKGIILLGNESKGISEDLIPLITERITIPKFSQAKEGIDSLNVGMAASIILSEFSRRDLQE